MIYFWLSKTNKLVKLQAYSADIGINTDTTSNLSSTCVVLELVAGRLDCQPRPNNQQQTLQLFLSSFRRQQFYLTVNIASEMHFNALHCIAQPNTALHDCMLYLTRDPMMQALQISASLGT